MTPSTARRPVVVGLDGSSCSGVAFAAAVDQARRRGVRLLAVHGWLVTEPGLPIDRPAVLDDDTEERLAKSLHESVVELLGGADDVQVEERTTYGYAGRVLVDASAGASLVVVGSRGLGVVRSALLGSVSQHVLENAACPVLVARGDAPVTPAGVVVVGVDGSATAKQALQWADEQARLLGVPLVVLYAAIAEGSGLDPAGPEMPAVPETRRALALWVQDALGRERAAEVQQVVEPAAPAGALLARSAEDVLLVVGHEGVGGFLRLGSVARRVATHADGPVVVVRRDA